jgi:hypothetical protein
LAVAGRGLRLVDSAHEIREGWYLAEARRVAREQLVQLLKVGPPRLVVVQARAEPSLGEWYACYEAADGAIGRVHVGGIQ